MARVLFRTPFSGPPVKDQRWALFEDCERPPQTQAWIRNGEHMISKDGTSIHPMVHDESDNWWNRRSLLVCYGDLVERMEALGIEPEHWNGDDQNPTQE